MIRIDIKGAVQGVGFRPTVFRAATKAGLRGAVSNAVDGVHIWIDTDMTTAHELMKEVRDNLPDTARIDAVSYCLADSLPVDADPDIFSILSSDTKPSEPTDVSPDIAICHRCLNDIHTMPRRLGYLLTNCTECGPRFSITRELPYDRHTTSMADFKMCEECRKEYTDPYDRRFHAQPISCNRCGPVYTPADPVKLCSEILRKGDPIIIKGTGGYNILCDARNEKAVERLRQLKHRPRKPFAVMMPSPEVARRYVRLSPVEEKALESWQAPIVISLRGEDSLSLPDIIAPGCSTIGIMLPYMGIHHMIAENNPDMPLVITSANRPGMPIIIDDKEALEYGTENDISVISYNRDIVHRLDDSVVRFTAARPLIYRRSRGYVPAPVKTTIDCTGVIGTGADVTSQWAFGKGNTVIQSPYIGSLVSAEGESSLRESIKSLSLLYRISPELVITDAHPAYTSARIGREIAAENGASTVRMWHHHAHAVSVMADRGISGPVLALVLDGTGAGPDNTVWGSELLRCTVTEFDLLAHGPQLPMPGGDRAATEPWRMAVSSVMSIDGTTDRLPPQLVASVGSDRIDTAALMIRRHINSPLSRGAGRLWDAVAALLGVAYINGYEAEAPILLEQLALRGGSQPPYPLGTGDPLSLKALLDPVIRDIHFGVPPEVVAARFHATYSEAWGRIITHYSRQTGLRKCVASGGVMQNVLLTRQIETLLSADGIELILPTDTPVNDGCIALGQVMYGATLRQTN